MIVLLSAIFSWLGFGEGSEDTTIFSSDTLSVNVLPRDVLFLFSLIWIMNF